MFNNKLLLLGVVFVLSATSSSIFVEANKRLILFAGPHRTGSSSVEEFFYKYCHGPQKKDKDGFPLRYWFWPQVPDTHNKAVGHPGMPQVFQNLVTDPNMNTPLNKDIIGAIKTAWEESESGIILGTEYFDQMGKYAQYDALTAMKEVVKAVGLESDPAYVTVVVNYRSPRFEHWVSVWRGSVEGTTRTYKDFMCHTRQYHEKMELLSTAVNPLQIAEESMKQSWRVSIMDMEGLYQAEKDISHTIACNVMDAKCSEEEGWVNNHKDEVIKMNKAEEGHDIVELNDKQRQDAEELLQARDCAYRANMDKLVEAGKSEYTVHGEYSIWQHCSPKHDFTSYQNLYDVELVFRGLLSQLNCRNVIYDDMPKSIDDILNGHFTLHSGSTRVSADGKVSNKKNKHHYFFWLLVLVGIYAGYRIKKNNNRVPQVWIDMAFIAKGLAVDMFHKGVSFAKEKIDQYQQQDHTAVSTSESEMESMDFGSGRPKATSLSGGII